MLHIARILAIILGILILLGGLGACLSTIR